VNTKAVSEANQEERKEDKSCEGESQERRLKRRRELSL
jgi:hypothetical protein